MNTVKTLQIVSSSSDATYEIGVRLGQACRSQEVFLLNSDLGGGKTTLAKGLAFGLGSKDNVTSPTFTISQIYSCSGGRKLYHFDFYRLDDAGIMNYELAEALEDPKGIIVVEWGDIVEGVLPKRLVSIQINYVADDENKRQLEIEYPEEWSYLTKDLK